MRKPPKMISAGAKKFKSKIGKSFSVTLTAGGLCDAKCTPRSAISMIALIQVDAAINLNEAAKTKQRSKAKKQFEPLFAKVQQYGPIPQNH